MKNLIFYFLFIGLITSCSKNDEPETQNKILLLKVDFLTHFFEGGKELEYSTICPNFTISSTYQAPGDFGSVQLYYDELNEKIFDGTIIWMGTGQMSFPTGINLPNTFSTTDNNVPIPNISLFEHVMYDDYAYYPDTIEYAIIWNSINNLEIIANYRSSNPNGKINLFLYTPSVGVGNPAEWDWFVIMKN